MACLAALIAPFGLAVVHEWITRRVTNVDQLRTELLLPVLGEIARFPTRVVARVADATKGLPAAKRRELYVYAESIDSLRTNLRLTESVGVPGCQRVIAVCSAASGEGKTSVATALAVSISEATQQPTLILDADLRDPDVATLLGVPDEPGVAEVLSGQVAAEDADPSGGPHPDVCHAGRRLPRQSPSTAARFGHRGPARRPAKTFRDDRHRHSAGAGRQRVAGLCGDGGSGDHSVRWPT